MLILNENGKWCLYGIFLVIFLYLVFESVFVSFEWLLY